MKSSLFSTVLYLAVCFNSYFIIELYLKYDQIGWANRDHSTP